jgi:hypothetical protein
MRLLRLIPTLALLAYSGPALAAGACGLTITASNFTINWTTSFLTQAVSFTVEKANATTCDYWVGITKGAAASAATRRMANGAKLLPYQVYKTNALANILKDSSDAPITSSNEVITDTFPAGTNILHTLQYFFDIPSSGSMDSTIVKDGTYTDTYTLNVYEGSDPTVAGPTPVTSSTITVTTIVPTIIRLSMVPQGGTFDDASINRTINFGVMSPGQSSNFDIRVRTNAGFSLAFSSANDGKMKPPAIPTSAGVPYLFYVNNALLDLSASSGTPVTVPSVSGETSMQGLVYPVKIVIGSFAATTIGGAQSDSITITATSIE